ncbi:MAG: peptidyl-alpha-hydroxyglycine alpha-amidating lyase family protein [Bryobacteraceae bacterium]
MKTVVMLAMMSAAQQTGWYPHEGGNLDYRVHIRFGEEPDTMPAGWKFGRVSSVGVDSAGRVYVFHRGDKADPMVVFDAEGRYLRGWGKGFFSSPHGLRIDKQDHLWITDTGLHQVFEFTGEGLLLRQWGAKGAPGCDEKTFNKPTDVAFASDGSFYVSDGYGNSRVVKFSAQGEFLKAWGTKGSGPGQFNLPHVVQTDSRGTVYVSDRENNRIQIFDAEGKFLREWTHLGATQGMHIGPRDEMWIVTHRNNRENAVYDTLAGRIMKIDPATGRIIGSMESPGHWITLNPGGEIFIGSLTGNVFRWRPR